MKNEKDGKTPEYEGSGLPFSEVMRIERLIMQVYRNKGMEPADWVKRYGEAFHDVVVESPNVIEEVVNNVELSEAELEPIIMEIEKREASSN